MTESEVIKQFLTALRLTLVDDAQRKNFTEGDLGTEIEVANNEGKLKGNNYWYYLVHGRKPGKMPPVQSILEWITKKGIKVNGSLKSCAFLMARKIGMLGTDIFLGKRDGLDLQGSIDKTTPILISGISDLTTERIEQDILKSLDNIFKK